MRTRDAASAVGGLVALAAAVLAVGGAPRWGQALVALIVGLGLIPLVTSRRNLARLSPLVAVLCGAAALSALQLIPLPSALLEHLNPTGTALRSDGLELVGGSAWPALTMDAPGTLRSLAMYLTLLGVAVIALRRGVSERGRFQLVSAVCAIAGVSAVLVGLHELFDATSLYGLYPVPHEPHLLGPLLNLNHLGCLMAVGTVTGIGLAAYGRQAAWLRAVWLVIAGICGSVGLATVSRGATLALVAGGFVTVGLLVAQRFAERNTRRRSSFWTRSLPIGIVALCLVVTVIYSNAGRVEEKFEQSSLDELSSPLSKYEAWRSSLQLVSEAPVLGVGRGASEPTLTRVHPSGRTVFSYLENEYLQVLVDWGVLGALVFGGAALWLVIVALRRWGDGPLAAAALGGLAVIGFQSMVDFGVELLGIAVPATLLAAAVTYVPVRESEGRRRGALLLRVAHVAALMVSGGLLISSLTTSIAEDHEKLRSGATSDEAITASIVRHPLDYYGYAVAAERAFRRGDPRGVVLLNHAMQLNPAHAGLHRLAAQRLVRSGHAKQAAIEYATAIRATKDPTNLIGTVVAELPPELVVVALPLDYSNPRAIISALRALQRPDLASAWLLRMLERTADVPMPCELLVSLAQAPGNSGTVLHAKRACPTEFSDADTLLRLAQALERDGRRDDVVSLLDGVAASKNTGDRKYRAWTLLCEAHRTTKRWSEATDCYRALASFGGLTPHQRQTVSTRLELLQRENGAAP